ncbi:MAG: hypothetical protein AAFQ80_17505 [Cyanobacteria bacterium J06621_8]
MLNLWNNLDLKNSDTDVPTFKAKTDLWLSVVKQDTEESSGTTAFTQKVLEHLVTNSETDS